jgi:hypothetical protein
MRRYSRLVGLISLIFGLILVFFSHNRPRTNLWHGAGILGLIAAGVCFGVGFVGLLGLLDIRDE